MKRLEKWAQYCAILTMFSLPISTSATSILYPLTALLSLSAGDWSNRFAFIRTNRVAQLFLVLFAIFLVGATYSIAPWRDITHTLIKHNWIILTPLLMPLFVEEKWRCYTINAFLLAAGITLVLSYLKFFHFTTLNFNYSDSSAVFKDYIGQSFALSLAFCFAFYRWQQQTSLRWFYALFALLILVNVMFMSQGRTGYIVFILLFAYCTTYHFGWKKGTVAALLGVAIMLFAAYYASPVFKQRSQITSQSLTHYTAGKQDDALSIRLTWQENAAKQFLQRPVFGYGTGSIPTVYAALPKNAMPNQVRINDTTSIYLNFALEFGAIGLLFFLWMSHVQWRNSFILSPELKFTVHILLIAILFGGLVNSWLTDFMQAHLYSLLMAMCFATEKR